jgi:hypothetical protein
VEPRARRRWENNIKMDLEYGMDSSASGKDSVKSSCECGNETSGSMRGGGFLDQLSN